MVKFENKIFLLLSLWEYPFGGGEEFLYQTAIWASQLGMKCYWLSFANASNENHKELKIIDYDYFISIGIPEGFSEKSLINWLKILKPDIIHHQGHLRKEFYKCCKDVRAEFITGIHYWAGILELDPKYGNIEIYKNCEKHKKSPDFEYLIGQKYLTFYSVSKYINDCVEKICGCKIENLSYSGSLKENNLVEGMDISENKYVTMVNIHKLKGGEILLQCLEELPEIPFIAVCTEYQSEELDKKIKDKITEINSKSKSNVKSIFMYRTNNMKEVYAKTKILLAASLIDETFCRVVNEAMMNGICILASGRGNLKYVIDDKKYIIDVNNKKDWVKAVKKYYYDKNELNEASKYFRKQYDKYSENICRSQFISLINNRIINGKNNNIMIFCPWCDQGLGIQSRNYYNILKKFKYNIFIFSYKPYNSDSAVNLQKNKSEWKAEHIYYSNNYREKVTDDEIIEFVNEYNIGICLIPETCWFRVFEIAKLLKSQNVKTIAIPNIEIIRKDEIYKHTYFDKILCNNHLCEKILNEHNILNTKYIGYAIYNQHNQYNQYNHNNTQKKLSYVKNEVKLLFIGGMNAFSRKQIIDVCKAFVLAYNINTRISLTCTIQKLNLLEENDIEKINIYLDHPKINFIQKHIEYNEIINLYNTHDIFIQVSKHEGLGISFYEALSCGIPIITLDTPPHNEIIINGVNGWTIPCYYKKMSDNDNGLIESAYFEPNVLANKILDVASDHNKLHKVFLSLADHNLKNYDQNVFSNIFYNAIEE